MSAAARYGHIETAVLLVTIACAVTYLLVKAEAWVRSLHRCKPDCLCSKATRDRAMKALGRITEEVSS